jgi:hypothetical protein
MGIGRTHVDEPSRAMTRSMDQETAGVQLLLGHPMLGSTVRYLVSRSTSRSKMA